MTDGTILGLITVHMFFVVVPASRLSLFRLLRLHRSLLISDAQHLLLGRRAVPRVSLELGTTFVKGDSMAECANNGVGSRER